MRMTHNYGRIGMVVLMLALVVSSTLPFLPHDNNPHAMTPEITTRTSYEFTGLIAETAVKAPAYLAHPSLFLLYSFILFFLSLHRRRYLATAIPVLLRNKLLEPIKFTSIYL